MTTSTTPNGSGASVVVNYVVVAAGIGALMWAMIPRNLELGAPVEDGRTIDLRSIETLIGAADAPVAVVEFSDFECTFCRSFALEVEPALHASYVETGKVAWGYQQYPIEMLHPYAKLAAEVAACASDQGKFYEVRQRLFRAGVPPDAAGMRLLVRPTGMDALLLNACLQSNAGARVEAQMEAAARLRIWSTPTFLIGRTDADKRLHVSAQLSGTRSVGQFSQILDRLVAATVN